MIKVVFPHAGAGIPIASLVHVHGRGVDRAWMEKRAAVLTKEIKQIRPEKGHSFIHAISMGCQEAYGANRNGDGFNEKSAKFELPDPKRGVAKQLTLDGGLTQYHNTFTKYAKVYKDHCFVDGTSVVMADRTRQAIETVRAGDLVAVRDGARRVMRVIRRHYRGLGLQLTLSGVPEPLVCTREHPFFVLRRRQVHCRHKYNRLAGNAGHAERCREYRDEVGDISEAPAVSLHKGDYLVFPRPRLGTTDVEPAFARLLGWVASEGYLGDKNTIQFTFSESNVEDIGAVQEQFRELGVHCTLTQRGDGLVALTASNKLLYRRLSRYIIGTFASKRLLPSVFELNEGAVRRLLEAYIDGDGCVQMTGTHVGDLRIRSSSPAMRRCLSDLIRALGTPTRMNDDFDGGMMTSPTNGLGYESRPSGVVAVGRSFASEVATGRKAAAVVEPQRAQTRDLLDDLYLVRIDNVQFVELDCDVNNLEVEGEHHYIAGEVLVHNCNKDPELASGEIVAEAYNPDMRRGELLIKVQDKKWGPELEKAANGEDIAFSMSCKVPYDICSVCGNKAANRREYCDHLKNEMTHVKEGGHQVFAINDRPCFFDFSGVFRPADRIAYGLQKVARYGEQPQEFIPSAMLAERLGVSAPTQVLMDSSPRPVQEKLAAMERLAAMEKQIEATGHALDPTVEAGIPCEAIPEDVLDRMRSCDFSGLMGGLAQARISLPVKDFFRLILGNKYDSVAGEMGSVESILPGVFSRMLRSGDGVEDVTGMQTYDPATSLIPRGIRDLIESIKPAQSVGMDPTRKRVQITIIRGGGPAGPIKMAKQASVSKSAQYLAKQYVAYQLAFSRAAGGVDGDLVNGMMVRRNYAG
jgi:hypothetical protein